MKKINFIVFSLVAFLMFSCDNAEDLLDINFKITKSFDYTVPRSPAGIPIPATGVEVMLPARTVNTTDDFKNNGTSADLIKDASLEKFTLIIPESSNEDFGFLKSIEIRVSSPAHPNEEILAQLHDIPANAGKVLELTASNMSLVKYIKDSEFSLHTSVSVDEPTTSEIPVKMTMTFNVTANPLKK